MKKLSVSLLFILAFCAFSFANSKFSEFEKAKQIKLLQSTREDVKKIFADYEHDEEENEDYLQYFLTENARIEVTFSEGNCADEDSDEIWNIAEWKVVKVKIMPKETLQLKDFKFDFSGFKKEIEDEESPEDFDYQDESSGVFFRIIEGEIEKIIFYPPKSNIAYLCTNEETSEIISGEKRIINYILEGDRAIYCSFVGTGIPGVFYDLSDTKSENHTITAETDEGSAVSGKTITKTVVVKECSECSQNQKTETSKP